MKIMNKIFPLLIIFALWACNGANEKEKKQQSKKAEKAVSVPEFNADSAYHFVKDQVDFGPRVPGTQAHNQCAAYLSNTLKRFADTVIIQEFKTRTFDKKTFNGKNIIASFNPQNKNRILLAAHWDSRPFADHDQDPENHNTPIDGANDGASGVGVLLEIARQFNMHNPGIGVDIILFDLEDYGQPEGIQTHAENDWALGSQYWSKTPHIPGYRARYGILLDMVGASDAIFTREGTSRYYASPILSKVWNIALGLGFGNYFSNEETTAILDDHVYINRNARIPTIDIIHHDNKTYSGFFEHWHTVNDTMENIDPATLNVVGQVVLTVVYRE